jgi:hypothetical protein
MSQERNSHRTAVLLFAVAVTPYIFILLVAIEYLGLGLKPKLQVTAVRPTVLFP